MKQEVDGIHRKTAHDRDIFKVFLLIVHSIKCLGGTSHGTVSLMRLIKFSATIKSFAYYRIKNIKGD